MRPDENEHKNQEEHLSQTGPNELNEEDLGLTEHEDQAADSSQENIADNENDNMEDPVNDLDEDEINRVFPANDDPDENSDIDDLNKTV